MFRYFILFSLLFINSSDFFSQKIEKIKGATGEYILPLKSDITSKEAFEKALNEAKLDALRKAGVVENISSSDILSTKQEGADFKQVFNSISAVEINGAVLNDSLVNETTKIDQFGNTVYRITLNVDVIKYETKTDPTFDFLVEGIKEYYENNEILSFAFLPYSKGYLKIFNINEIENFIVYPFSDKDNPALNDIPDYLFESNKKIKFPINKLIGKPETKEEGYIVSTEQSKERNSLIFVFTKENIPFKSTPNYKNIISWIYKINPDKRKIQYFEFTILNRKNE